MAAESASALVRIQVRRDTAEAWDSVNPVLAAGEPGMESDTNRFKLGDGIRTWRDLPYSSGALPADVAPLDVGVRSSGDSETYARADHSHAWPSAVTVVSLTAGTATIAGNLSVTGNLIGGTHSHTAASISDWNAKSSAAVWNNLAEGSNVTLTRDPESGVVTISASGGSGGDVSSVAGRTGDVVLSTSDISDFPNYAAHPGKFLRTDGLTVEWANPYEGGGVASVNELYGNVVVKAGNNVEVFTNPSTNEVTINATASGGTGDVTSVNGLIGAVGIAAAANSGISVSASGSTVTLDASISYDDLTNVPTTFAPAAHTHATGDITGLNELVEDIIDTTLVAGTNVTLTYDDAAGQLTIDAAGASAPTLVAGNGIAIDQTSVPGEAEFSLAGDMDGGEYTGFGLAPDAAYFSVQPQNQLVTYGTALFTARVENMASPSYQWQKAEAGTDTFAALSNTSPYSGVTTQTLSVSPVSVSDNGDKYRVLATASDGSSIVSDIAILSSVAMTITDQPLPAEFEEADTLDVDTYLMVMVDGGAEPLSYQWQKWNGSAWADLAGETSYFVDSVPGILSATESLRVDRYRVKVTDAAGASLYSDEAEITIRAGVPTITLQPVDQTINAGSATLYVEYSGKETVVAWERRMPSEEDFSPIGKSGSVTTVSPGVYRSTLSLTGLTGNDSGSQYRLRVGNQTGDVVSDDATVALSAPIISVQPVSVTAIENTQATFSVVASYGGGAITYQWQELPVGGSWTDLSGATSATLTLPAVTVATGRDGSNFRVKVTGGTVTTTSKSAALAVISAPTAGDQIFTIDPADAVIEEGGGYQLSAVSTYLSSTTHYAIVRVEYDDGAVEYHPLTTGVSWNGTVTRTHTALAHSEYKASLMLSRSAWVSVCASASDPLAISRSGGVHTMQPFTYAKVSSFTCTATSDPARPRLGVLSIPVTPQSAGTCAAHITFSYPDPPYTYVESQRARVTIRPRQAFIGPVPQSGFWNPPTSLQYTGAASASGQYVVVAAKDEPYGSYLYSSNGGKAWMTRNLPFSFRASKAIFVAGSTDKFYLFGAITGLSPVYTALVSVDGGATFYPTGWTWPGSYRDTELYFYPSLAGGNLYVVNRGGYAGNSNYHYRHIHKLMPNGTWSVVNSTTINANATAKKYVSYAHGRWFCGNMTSTNGTDFIVGVNADAERYVPVSLPDATQNYVLSSNGKFAPVNPNPLSSTYLQATTAFSDVTNGQPGCGPQAGDFVYFGSEDRAKGAAFYRKGAGNPGANELLLSHTKYWSGNQRGEWADTQIMSYVFGSGYGANLDMNYYTTVSDPNVDGVIFLPDRLIHIFRYRTSTGGSASPPSGSIPVPPRR